MQYAIGITSKILYFAHGGDAMRLSNPLLRPQFPHPISMWFIVVTVLLLIFPSRSWGQLGIGDTPNLGDDRITQEQITDGTLSLKGISGILA